MNNGCINKALEALEKRTDSPFLNDEQRHKVRIKIRNIINYYFRELEIIRNIRSFYISRNREFKISSDVVDYIVIINGIINGHVNPDTIDKINVKQDKTEKRGFLKIKRLS